MAAPINPKGSKSEKHWRDAIRRAVAADDGTKKTKRLFVIAEKLVTMAEAGDMAAIKEIGDRLDGKPAQAIIGGDADTPPVRILHEADKDIIARYINSRKGIE